MLGFVLRNVLVSGFFFFQKASEQNNQKIVFAKIYVANGSNKAVTDHITNELKGAGVFVEEMI